MRKLLEYKNIYYEIKSDEKGSSYCIFEYTPIINAKHEIAFGSCCHPNYYTEEYVKKTIDNILEKGVE